ncbi:MAG: flagellar hook assembly protein FlgD [Nitriliruptoraceae bacterium]
MPEPLGAAGTTPTGGLHGSVDEAMDAMGGMDSEGFLNLLVAQLQHQDPLDPSEPQDLMVQTSQLAQLDATQQLLQTQSRQLSLQQSLAASGMLGTQVTAVGPQEEQVEGVVDSIRYTAAGPVLGIGDTEVAMSEVAEQRLADGATQPDPEEL